MKTILRRAAVAVTGSAIAVSGALVATSAPAAAAGSPIDVVKIRVVPSSSGQAINYKTKYFRIATTARQVAPFAQYTSATVYADVFRGSRALQRRVQIAYISSSGYKSMTGGFSFRNGWGRGNFRVANVRVQYNNRIYADRRVSGGAFRVKSAVDGKLKYGNVFTIRSRGTRKNVAIGVKAYTPRGWKGAAGTRVSLQYKKGGWKTRKTLRLNRQGQARYSFRSSAKYSYRVVIRPTATQVGGNSTSTPRT